MYTNSDNWNFQSRFKNTVELGRLRTPITKPDIDRMYMETAWGQTVPFPTFRQQVTESITLSSLLERQLGDTGRKKPQMTMDWWGHSPRWPRLWSEAKPSYFCLGGSDKKFKCSLYSCIIQQHTKQRCAWRGGTLRPEEQANNSVFIWTLTVGNQQTLVLIKSSDTSFSVSSLPCMSWRTFRVHSFVLFAFQIIYFPWFFSQPLERVIKFLYIFIRK